MAFAHSGSPEVVKLVQKWPNAANNSTACQVPSVVQYSDPIARQIWWGYDIPDDDDDDDDGNGGAGVLKWFKLLLQERPTGPILAQGFVSRSSGLDSLLGGLALDSSSTGADQSGGRKKKERRRKKRQTEEGSKKTGGLSKFEPSSMTPAQSTVFKLCQSNLTPVAVVTDFLAAVRETALASIEGTYGSEWTRAVRKEYVLTVPAMWTDAAKSHMVKAAHDAGFGVHRADFNLISEPEAAAAYTLRAIQPNRLEVPPPPPPFPPSLPPSYPW